MVLTTESAKWLEEGVQGSTLVEEHAEMGSGLTPWAIALFVLAGAVWLLGRAGPCRERRRSSAADSPAEGGASAVARLASSLPMHVAALVIALAVAVGAVIGVYRIAGSGAKAVRHGRFSVSASGGRQ